MGRVPIAAQVALLTAPLLVASPVRAQTQTAADLGWLAGCWMGTSGQGVYEEQWMSPGGGMLIGMSRTVRGDRTVAYEFLRIEAREGRLAYVARPSGQAEAAFPLVKVSAWEAVFENLAHDFPQRIMYARTGGALRVRVESAEGKKGQDFPMTATPCPGERR
jgi:hypothetical protein